MNILNDIKKRISELDYDKPKNSSYIEYSNTKILELEKIKKTLLNEDIFFCSETEYYNNLKNYTGLITNHLLYQYNFSLKNKKSIFKSILKECLIKDKINFYINHKNQVFINIKKLIELMKKNGFKLIEKKYIKINSNISLYDDKKPLKFEFKTVQQFKKWLKGIIPTNINNIEVKKNGNKYIVSSNIKLSIPYQIESIKKLNVELINIDDHLHLHCKNYDLINYKEKELLKIDEKIEKLSYSTIVKEELYKQILPKGKGSKKRIGKVSDKGIERVIGIPIDTQSNWKKSNETDYRFKLYMLLKNYTEDELLHMVKKGMDLLN